MTPRHFALYADSARAFGIHFDPKSVARDLGVEISVSAKSKQVYRGDTGFLIVDKHIISFPGEQFNHAASGRHNRRGNTKYSGECKKMSELHFDLRVLN